MSSPSSVAGSVGAELGVAGVPVERGPAERDSFVLPPQPLSVRPTASAAAVAASQVRVVVRDGAIMVVSPVGWKVGVEVNTLEHRRSVVADSGARGNPPPPPCWLASNAAVGRHSAT